LTTWPPFLDPQEADLDFAGTLAAIQGLVGQHVSVTTADREGKPIIVARLEGTLRRSADMSFLERADAEAQFFYVTEREDDERPIGFMLHAGAFGGGQRDEDVRVRFLQGGVLVDVRAEG
jgi:uncharacterized protein GlcG (DUF336 family)